MTTTAKDTSRTAGTGGGTDARKTLLIVDDEPNIRRVLEALFQKDYRVLSAENGLRAVDIAATTPIDILITDLIMPDMNGVELLRTVRRSHPRLVAVMITAYATIKTCVDAMRYGASDYITKPFDVDEMKAIVKRAVARQADEPAGGGRSRRGQSATPMTAAVSPAMREVEEMIGRVAKARSTVLIRGESGTGKELVARALHQQSDRASGPFVGVSCAALPETLLESELFGHEKNAFTGAAAEKKGRFELANGGTLFLDEIGDLQPSVQIKLLRVLQEREFERIGGVKPIKVDVRLIAATNADLEDLMRAGKFRQDLYYRLNVIPIHLPPLRERPEDIPALAADFLKRFASENGRALAAIDASAMDILRGYPWPGNVRELENVIERCAVMSDAKAASITTSVLPQVLRDHARLY